MAGYRILLVEDEAIIAIDSQHRLEKLSHEVVSVVEDGETALATLQNQPLDLILMDI